VGGGLWVLVQNDTTEDEDDDEDERVPFPSTQHLTPSTHFPS
jgi:hypothetical protein